MPSPSSLGPLALYCFVCIVFLGGAVGLSRDLHSGVDLFVNMLPLKVRRVLDILTSVLVAAFAAMVIDPSLPVLNMNMFQRSPALGVQMSWIYIAIPISMGLIFLISAEPVCSNCSPFRTRRRIVDAGYHRVKGA